MGGHETTAPAGWLVIATLPEGERYVVVPPDREPVDCERATSLASTVGWHSDVHAVGEAVPVWQAGDWNPDDEEYDLPAPWQVPILEDEIQHTVEQRRPALSQVYYLIDGQPTAGTLSDYARAHAWSQVDLIDVPDVVWTWQVVLTPDAPGGATWGWTDHAVEVTTEDQNGYRVVTLRVLDEQLHYQLGATG